MKQGIIMTQNHEVSFSYIAEEYVTFMEQNFMPKDVSYNYKLIVKTNYFHHSFVILYTLIWVNYVLIAHIKVGDW